MGTQAGSSEGRRASARAVASLTLAFLVVATLLVFASPAPAQILPPLPPLPGGGGGGSTDPGFAPTSETLSSPDGTAPMYGTNASRTGQARDSTVFGVLGQAWSQKIRDAAVAGTPLIAGGRVIVGVAGSQARVLALDKGSGRIAWQKAIGDIGFDGAHPPPPDGIVVVGTEPSLVRAFALGSGKPLWQYSAGLTTPVTPPVIDDGVVYLATGGQNVEVAQLTALKLDTGAVLWSRSVDVPYELTEPALDQARIFLADECGGAIAISRATGATIWERESGQGCYQGVRAVVSGGRLFAAHGLVFDAVTGAPLGRTAIGLPGAVVGDVAYSPSGTAQRLDADKPLWKARGIGAVVSPVVGDGTVYMRSAHFLVGLDVANGRYLSAVKLRSFSGGISSTQRSGLALGGGMVVVGGTDHVQAFRPLMRPKRRRSVLFTNKSAVPAGNNVYLTAGVGAALRKRGRKVTLLAANAGAKKLHPVKRAKTRSDGTAQFKLRLHRNTRVMADPAGGQRSPGGTIYANPEFRIQARRTSDTRGVISTGVSRVPAGELAKRKVVAYIVKVNEKVVSRLGVAPLHRTGAKSARAKVRFKLLKHAGRRDYLFVCVPGLARAGWGFADRYQRRCGAKRLEYGKRRRTAAAARIATPQTLSGGGSPGGLLRSARGQAVAAAEAPGT